MKLVVVYATLGRAPILKPVLENLRFQTRLADLIVVSAVSPEDVIGSESSSLHPEIIFGPKGLCAQRNHAMNHLVGRSDIIIFLDDDFIVADDYLEEIEKIFQEYPECVGLTGRVIADGAKSAGFTFEEGVEILAKDKRVSRDKHATAALYGCNMSIRSAAADGLAFDERLPAYGWLEDVDFTYRLGKRGLLFNSNRLNGVHLATKTGRTSGKRFGYSQIANPMHLLRTGGIPVKLAYQQMLKNICSNVLRVMWPESYIDRKGRLVGNILGLKDLMTFRLDPEKITSMK